MDTIGIVLFILLSGMFFIPFVSKSLKRKKSSSIAGTVAYKAKNVMTRTEFEIFTALNDELKDEYLLLAQVRLGDLIEVDTTYIKYKSSEWYSSFNKISAKSCDLVIINKLTGEIKVCIEINDFTHAEPKRINRDVFLKSLFEKLNIPLFFIDKSNYTSTLPKELFRVN